MSILGRKPDVPSFATLAADAGRARQMLAESKNLWNNPARCGEAIKLRKEGQALRDQTIERAKAAAGPRNDAPSAEQRDAAAFLAALAHERAVTGIEDLQKHLKLASIFDETPDPDLMGQPRKDLNTATNANDRARLGDDGQPLFAPGSHMTAIQLTLMRVTMAQRQFAEFPVTISQQDGVLSPQLDELDEAREIVKLVREQRADRATLARIPNQQQVQLLMQQTAGIDQLASGVDVQIAVTVGMLAVGMAMAIATPEQLAMMPLEEGLKVSLPGIIAGVRGSFGAADDASFKEKVGGEQNWAGFVWQFASAELGRLNHEDPAVQKFVQGVEGDIAATMQNLGMSPPAPEVPGAPPPGPDRSESVAASGGASAAAPPQDRATTGA
jgi:hypothetical protein